MGGFEAGRDSPVPEVKAKTSSSYGTMGGFERGRDSIGIMTRNKQDNKQDNEEDDNSFISNVTNSAKALLTMLGKASISTSPLVSFATSVAGAVSPGPAATTQIETPVVTEEVKKQFKLGTGDFEFAKPINDAVRDRMRNKGVLVADASKDAGMMSRIYDAQRMLDANKPKGAGTVANQLNAFRRIERENSKSVWQPVHDQYYQTEASDFMRPLMRPNPKQANEYMGLPSLYKPRTRTEFNSDLDFQKALKEINIKHGVQEEDIYKIMLHESGFVPTAINANYTNSKGKAVKGTGAVGLFQFLPKTLKTKNNFNKSKFSPKDIQNMSPANQLRLYSDYLTSWNYKPGDSIALMQAAPARRDRKGNTEIYTREDSPLVFAQNPGWINAEGLITANSINAYYGLATTDLVTPLATLLENWEANIEKIQEILEVTVDGYMGPNTVKAIRKTGYKADIKGPIYALRQKLALETNKDKRRAIIEKIQKILDVKDVKVDGIIGPKTITALKNHGEIYIDPAAAQIAVGISSLLKKPEYVISSATSFLVKPDAEKNIVALLDGPLKTLQEKFGKNLVINDALPKVGTDREVDTPTSRHFHGDAVDISTSGMSNAERLKLVDDALASGFKGFGFGPTILHVDLGKRRAWDYKNEYYGGKKVGKGSDLFLKVREYK